MSDGSVIIDTELNNDGLNKDINNIDKSFSKLKSIAVKAISAIGFGTLVKEGITYNATVEQLQTSFEVMTGSAEKATEVVEKLKDIGAKTPFEFTGLAETTQLLMNYGFEADDAIDKMQMLGDISQGSADKMNRIATAYGQMSSAGKVSLEDIKQMIEAGFNPLQEISQTTGESMASLYDRISKGTISIDEITASMERSTSVGGKYFQSMDKQSQTLNGQWSTLKDNFSNILGSILKPISEILTNNVLPAVNEFLSTMSEKISTSNLDDIIEKLKNIISAIESIGIAFLSLKAGIAIQGIVQAFQKAQVALSLYSLSANGASIAQGLFNGTLTTAEGIVALLTGKITLAQVATGLWQKAQLALHAVMSANPIALIITLIGALVAGIIYLWNTNEGFRNALISAWETIKSSAISVWGWIEELFTKKIPEWIQNVIDWFGKLPGNVWNYLKETLNKIINWITNTKNTISQKIPEIINNIINWFKKLPESMLNIGKNIVEGLWNGISNMANWIKGKVKDFISGITDGVKGVLGIHSPSTVFRDEVGKNMALGIGEGFDNSLSSIFRKMKSTVAFETQKLSANLSTSTSMNKILTANITLNPSDIYMDSTKVGRMVTPVVSRTIREGGAY